MVACTADTNSVDLGFDGTGNLTADVRLRTIADGSLTTTVNGVGVAVASDGGIIASSSGAEIKVAQGLHVGAEGLMKINGYASTTSPGSAPVANLARGVNVQYGNTLSLTGSLASSEVASWVMVFARWRGIFETNLTSFGGLLLDRVDAYLQLNLDGGGWGTADQFSLTRANCGGTFALEARYGIAMTNNTSHTIQSRLLCGGGTVTGSAVQGVLESEYGGTLEWIY